MLLTLPRTSTLVKNAIEYDTGGVAYHTAASLHLHVVFVSISRNPDFFTLCLRFFVPRT